MVYATFVTYVSLKLWGTSFQYRYRYRYSCSRQYRVSGTSTVSV